jgi:hypothetical protein
VMSQSSNADDDAVESCHDGMISLLSHVDDDTVESC